MADTIVSSARLEREMAEPVLVSGNCSIGRGSNNDVVLADERISRRHATIHAQGEHEFLVVDLGSRNGTYLNGRRVNQPTSLADGDQLQIGPFTLTFRQPSKQVPILSERREEAQTMVELKSTSCWLLLIDITGSSKLAREKTGPELAVLVGGWFGRCKDVIEDSGGVINKYLGDGLLAYWRARSDVLPHVAAAVGKLQSYQQNNEPKFRIVLHYGQVTIGGVPSGGEDSLAGPEVNLVFRLERLASELHLDRLTSAAAVQHLGPLMKATSAGEHPLQGFEGKHPVFTF